MATPMHSRLLSMDNPAIEQIARLGDTQTGEKGGPGMIQLQQAEIVARLNWVNKFAKKYSEAELKEAVDARINGTQPTSDKAKQAYKELDIFFDDFHKYARTAFKEGGSKDPNGGIGYIKHYWPMLWDAEKVMKGREEFLKMIAQPKYASFLDDLKVTPTELWENISGYVTRGDTFQGVMGLKNEPVNSYSQERSLGFLDPEDRKPFMDDNALLTMVNYVPMMVRQAEYVRAYGKAGVKLESMLEEAEDTYGATPDQLARTRDYVASLLGNREIGMSRELKDLYGAATVYQNYRLLPFNLFSSLVDPLGIAVRSNNIGDAFETFVYSTRNLFRDLKKDRPEASKDFWEKLAEDWGYIEDAGTMSNLRHMVETTELHGFSKKMNDALFKWNLLNGWTRSTKIMAVKAAQRFFLRSAEGEDALSKRNLEELGLMKSDIVSDGAGGIALTVEALEAQGVSKDQAIQIEKRLHDATTKFVNQAILNPNAGDLPNWASNPYLAPIFHLKQFMFTFQNVILKRIIGEMEQGNFKPLWVSGIYIPGMIGADFLRGMISNMGEQPPWQKDWGVYDYVGNGVSRSGLTGVGQMFLNMKDDVMHGGRGYESAVGPTIEQIMKGTQAVVAGDTRLYNFIIKAIPLNQLADQWLLHAPTGGKNG